MGEAHRDVALLEVVGRQHDADRAAERGRTAPQIDGDIEYLARITRISLA
jgi:hypothetical protein